MVKRSLSLSSVDEKSSRPLGGRVGVEVGFGLLVGDGEGVHVAV